MTRIAIATDAEYVSEHFGRCMQYTIVDIEGNTLLSKRTIANPGHAPGAIPQFLHSHKVDTVVCGGIGTRAQALFDQMGIQMIAGITGSVDETIQRIQNGELEGGQSMCSPGGGRGFGIEKTECDHAHDA